ncbi:MAG: DUF1501 domain-containing protein, partial [Planctomycetota bacterium]
MTANDHQHEPNPSRRAVLGAGMGAWALGDLLSTERNQGTLFRPRCRRVIWLFQSGGPSQLDLFDPKPELVRRNGEDL